MLTVCMRLYVRPHKGCILCCVFSVLPLSSSLRSLNLEGSEEGSISIKDKWEEKQRGPTA